MNRTAGKPSPAQSDKGEREGREAMKKSRKDLRKEAMEK